MLSYLLISMANGSKKARWSDLATRRDSESDSEDSSLSKVLEHAEEQSLSPSTSSSKCSRRLWICGTVYV